MLRYWRYLPPALAFIVWLTQFFLPGYGMDVFTGIVVFLIVWWLILFMILPLGSTGQAESGEMVQGTESGAPVVANLKRKVWTTTVVASIVWLVLFVILEFQLVTINDIPFLGPVESWYG